MSRLGLVVALVLLSLSAGGGAVVGGVRRGRVHPAVGLDSQAPELSGLDIRDAFTWGVQAARLFTPNWGAEVLWTQQSSALRRDRGRSADLFTMTVRQLHGNAVREFGAGDARVRPFVFAGLGATFFSADDLQSETKLSLGLGGGVKYFVWRASASVDTFASSRRH